MSVSSSTQQRVRLNESLLDDAAPPRTASTTRRRSSHRNSLQMDGWHPCCKTPTCCARRVRCCCFTAGFCFWSAISFIFGTVMFLANPSMFMPKTCPVPMGKDPPPEAPSQVTSNRSTSVSVDVAWDPPNAYNKTIIRYQVNTSIEGSHWIQSTDCAVIQTVCTLKLQPNQSVGVIVRGFSEAGPGNWSEPAFFRTLPSSRPQPPDDVKLSFHIDTVAIVSWGASEICSTADDPTWYDVQMAEADGPADCPAEADRAWQEQAGQTKSTQQHMIQLRASTDYCARVRAKNRQGWSSWSQPITFTTLCVLTPGEELINAAPNVTITPVVTPDSDSVLLEWSTSAGNCSQIDHFEAKCEGSLPSLATVHATTGGLAANMTIRGLTPRSKYSCSVRARNAYGPSAWSRDVEATTLPPQRPVAPAAPVSGVAGTPTLVSWTPPSDDRGSKVVSYELRVSNWWVGAGVHVSVYNGSNTQFSFDLKGVGAAGCTPAPGMPCDLILPDSEYEIQVRAWNGVGPSDWSPPVQMKLQVEGRCGNRHDVQIFHDQFTTMSGHVGDAIMGCITAQPPEDCIANKLHQSTHLSTSCGMCWGHDGICVENSCFTPCVLGDKHGDKCVSCSKQHCTPDMLSCAGLPDWVFPTK